MNRDSAIYRNHGLLLFALFALTLLAYAFLYLPSLGLAGCLGVAVDALCRRAPARYAFSRWLAPAVIALICVAFGVRTFIRNFDWDGR